MSDKISNGLLPVNPDIVLDVLQETIEQLIKLETRIAGWHSADIRSVGTDLKDLRKIAHSLEHKAERLEDLL